MGCRGNRSRSAVVCRPMTHHLARARHAVTPVALTGLLLLAACTTAQAGPTASPTASPDPTPSPIPTGQVGQIEHPTGPTDIVLRMHVGGGFVPMEVALIESPAFTLYGDNTVIFRPSPPQGHIFDPSAPQAAYVKATMNADQVDALLSYALNQGGLLDAREDYSDIGIADAPTTTFTINAGGVDKQVAIVALAPDPGPDSADSADRAKFAVLADLLDSFETEVEKGNVELSEPYVPTMYKAMLPEAFEGQHGVAVEWPWDDLTMDDFPITAESGFPNGYITAEQAALVIDVPSGGVGGLLLEGPDGKLYSLAIRPLLPDEEPVTGEPIGTPEATEGA